MKATYLLVLTSVLIHSYRTEESEMVQDCFSEILREEVASEIIY